MKNFIYTFFFFSALVSFSTYSNGRNTFNYYGIGIQNIGYDDIEFSPNIEKTELLPDLYSKNTSGTGVRAFMGHHFNQYFAVEAGITSHGKANFLVYREAIDSEGTINKETIHRGDFSTISGDIRLIGTYAIGKKMFLRAHVGSLFWNNEFDYLSGNVGELVVKNESDTGASLLTGIGLGYSFTKNIAVSFEFENTKIANIKTQTISLSMMLRF